MLEWIQHPFAVKSFLLHKLFHEWRYRNQDKTTSALRCWYIFSFFPVLSWRHAEQYQKRFHPHPNNDVNLKEILEDKNNNQKENEKEKKVENKNDNNEIYNKVIEEQKNKDESEDVKDKKANKNGKNNSKLNENNNNEEKVKEKKEIKEEQKEEPKGEKEEEPKEKEKEKEENNIANNKDNNNNNINDQQAEKNNNINKENKVGENKDKTNVNNNKSEEEKNNKVENKANETQKNEKKVLKVKNNKPKIRPKNTSDAALCRSLNASPTHSKGQNKPSFQNKKENNEQQNNKSTQKNNSNNINQNNDQNNNNKNEEKPEDKGTNNKLVEKKEPEDVFDIKNIISEYRLNHLKDDEIIFSGTLDKILKIPEKNTITYSQRFCIFTKNYFAYYKSKESYISLNKPMLVINNKLIIRIENTSLDGDNYYFGIICVVNDETKDIIKKVNSFVTNEGNICELLLGFRTKQYENMMKWIIILRYFISKQNE